MSPETAKEKALEIIKMIDYDMWKECVSEPDEWELVVENISYALGDIFNDGYSFCEVDNGLDGP